MENIDKFQKWLELQPEVFQVSSIVDIMKRLNKNLHGDNQNFYTVPSDKKLSSQYLLLYEMSLHSNSFNSVTYMCNSTPV